MEGHLKLRLQLKNLFFIKFRALFTIFVIFLNPSPSIYFLREVEWSKILNTSKKRTRKEEVLKGLCKSRNCDEGGYARPFSYYIIKLFSIYIYISIYVSYNWQNGSNWLYFLKKPMCTRGYHRLKYWSIFFNLIFLN